MLTTTIDHSTDFVSLFADYGRGDQYSATGFRLLFAYLEDLSEDMGEDIRIDVVGLCCDWTEYEDEDEAAEAYDMDVEELRDSTIVLDTYAAGLSGTTVMVLNF